MREPLPIMPRTVSVSVVQVRLSPTSVSNGSRYWVNRSFHSNSHFMATAPKRSTNTAMILPQPGKRDYEWMSSRENSQIDQLLVQPFQAALIQHVAGRRA